jgi:hypothetical protein
MLAEAARRLPGHAFTHGDVCALPYADASFDAVTTVYTLRNFPDLDAGLLEMVWRRTSFALSNLLCCFVHACALTPHPPGARAATGRDAGHPGCLSSELWADAPVDGALA